MLSNFRFFKWSGKKAVALLVLTVLLVMAPIGGVIAYIASRTRTVTNNFPPAEVLISSWNKGDVINSGNVEVYVRASVVAAWVSNEDKRTVWAVTPKEGTDYDIVIEDGWFRASDGFYYKAVPIRAAQSANFISATQKTEKDGYTLRVLISYSAIQVTPKDAVESAWPEVIVTADGSLTEK